jgi:predicted DNA-binding protein YlxM (UPF0122 family)
VYHRRKKLGLILSEDELIKRKSFSHPSFTEKDDLILTKYYKYLSDNELADLIGRTRAGVYSRRKKLKLMLSKEENQFRIRNWKVYSDMVSLTSNKKYENMLKIECENFERCQQFSLDNDLFFECEKDCKNFKPFGGFK